MILAKSDGTSLREHTFHVLRAVEALSDGKVEWELVRLAALYHDAGKVYPGFQKKIDGREENLPDVPHSFLSVVFVPKEILEKLGDEDSAVLLSAVAFHHWRDSFLDYLMGSKKGIVFKAFEWLLENSGKILEDLRGEIENASFNPELARYLTKASIIDTGVILPPHILSTLPSFILRTLNLKDETYRRYVFVSGNLKRADRFASMAEKEGLGVEKIKINFKGDKNEILKEKLKGFELWQLENLNDANTVLIAPTGSGKTEYALFWGKDKIVFTLPLRSAVNSIHSRLSKYFGKENVGLLHSDADLVIFEKLYSLDPEFENEVFKSLELSRFLSYPFVVTTGDQIFPSAFKYPGYEIIYATLMESSLVVDEIQAYEPYAAAAIVKLLEDVESLGGRFLLMTATLPSFIKRELEVRTSATFKDVYGRVEGSSKSVVRIMMGNYEDFVKLAIEFYGDGKRVLVIRNTVKKAIDTFKKLKNLGVESDVIHSHLTFEDRAIKEERLSQYAPGNEGKPIVLVSTQVAEASLNIDFDVLITDAAPPDSLVQRMGRVYRKRPYDSNEPNVYVIVVPDKDGRIETFRGVYRKSQILSSIAYMCCPNFLESIRGKKTLRKIENEILKKLKKTYADLILDATSKKLFVERVYEFLENIEDEYIKSFREALAILDGGYVAETRADAQRIFRRISSIDVVPENIAEDLIESLEREKSILGAKMLIRSSVVSVPLHSINVEDLTQVEIDNPAISRYAGKILILEGGRYEHGVGLV